jgi:hypothetical protein
VRRAVERLEQPQPPRPQLVERHSWRQLLHRQPAAQPAQQPCVLERNPLGPDQAMAPAPRSR